MVNCSRTAVLVQLYFQVLNLEKSTLTTCTLEVRQSTAVPVQLYFQVLNLVQLYFQVLRSYGTSSTDLLEIFGKLGILKFIIF